MRDFVARFPAGRVIAERMSDSLVKLLDDCMSLEPGRRPTAAQLLGYAWFTEPPPAAPPAGSWRMSASKVTFWQKLLMHLIMMNVVK